MNKNKLDYLKTKLSNLEKIVRLAALALRLLITIEELSKYGIIHNVNEWITYQNQLLRNQEKQFKKVPLENTIKEIQSRLQSFIGRKSDTEIIRYIEGVKELNIQEKETLEYCSKSCSYLIFLMYNKITNTFEETEKYDELEYLLLMVSFETIGYWTAKLETMKTNKERGAKVMKDKGDQNKKVIRQIMKEQNIISMDFRGNKDKREIFYNTARTRTKEIDKKNKIPLTDSRIQKIGREISKEDKPLI